jgi:hypothetical protein
MVCQRGAASVRVFDIFDVQRHLHAARGRTTADQEIRANFKLGAAGGGLALYARA